MQKNFQIIFLTPGFPKDESDTSCIPALQDFIFGWKKFFPEAEIKVISFQYPFHQKKYWWNGIEVFSAGGKNRKGIFRLLPWKKTLNQLSRWSTPETILISYFLTEATLVAQRFSQNKKLNHIAIAAGQDVKRSNRYLKRLKVEEMKVVVFNEKMNTEFFKSTGRNAAAIIPMGIRVSQFNFSEATTREIDMISVGSLIPLKQIDVALKIISELHLDFPSLKIEIVGDGNERRKLERQTLELDLKSNVVFTGSLTREEVIDKMKQAKILLHTSSYEGQSTVISEALACGCTVVCFDVGRMGDHEKIKVCANENEMIVVLKKLIDENKFDFSPAIYFTMQQTISNYVQLISHFLK